MWHWQVAWMSTESWHCWGYTDHQGTLIISALRLSSRAVRVTAQEERNADNRH
ncbi:unnamed protein product, partial [Staurois parvus]